MVQIQVARLMEQTQIAIRFKDQKSRHIQTHSLEEAKKLISAEEFYMNYGELKLTQEDIIKVEIDGKI